MLFKFKEKLRKASGFKQGRAIGVLNKNLCKNNFDSRKAGGRAKP